MKKIIEQIQNSETVAVCGNGTRGGTGDLRFDGADVIEYSPEELFITVQAGMEMEALEALLDENGQMLPFEPQDNRVILGTKGAPTIGGALGVNADGPRRLRYGAMRDAVLGTKFIDGRGELVRTGGKVMKNVTGLDLTKFFTGSRGAIGVATELTMKLLPKPKETMSLTFDCGASEFDAKFLTILRRPFDIAAASWHEGKAFFRLEGVDLSTSRKLIEAEIGKVETGGDWQALRDWEMLADADEIWRIHCRPSQSMKIAEVFGARALIALGGAQVIVAASEHEIESFIETGMHAVCEKGALGKRLPEISESRRELELKLKTVFDPQGKFGVSQ